MKNTLRATLLTNVLAAVLLGTAGSAAAGERGVESGVATRMLSQPAIHGDRVAFVYAGDLWTSHRNGTGLRRLTTHPGNEGRPRFSPDGKTIAFTGQYDGNTDVYLVSVSGGVPRRLTWHPLPDVVQGFTPDGSAVLFTSRRMVHTMRFEQLFTVPVAGGNPTRLPIPNAAKASFSPDGTHIAYTPLRDVFHQWKNYRGGTAARIWVYDVADHSVEQIPQPEGRCNDTDPCWVGSDVAFLSDRAGEFNLFTYAPGSGTVVQRTEHDAFPAIYLTSDGRRLIYEHSGWLRVFDPPSATDKRLELDVPADLIETRPRYAKGKSYIRSGGISPSGKRAVFGFRGEILTVPAEHGDARNLTRSLDVHERHPAWSPDGKHIAYFSDASGEYELHIAPSDGKGEVRAIELDGSGFYQDTTWSPDSKYLSFEDNSWTLYLLEVETGEVRAIATQPLYSPVRAQSHSWSPDSKWITYTLSSQMYFKTVHLYEVATGGDHAITDGLSDAAEPTFDASGEYLYFSASTDAGPANTWFAMSGADIQQTNALYVAVLLGGEPSPFAARSDEEEFGDEEEDEGEEEADDEEGEDGEADEEEEEAEEEDLVAIDFDGLDQRIVALPLAPAYYHNLQAGAAGKLFYLKADEATPFGPNGTSTFCVFDLEEREEKELAENATGFALSADHEKVLLAANGGFSIAAAGSPVKEGRLDTDSLEVKIDPRAEWPQILDEVWRINRDYFYDPDMHGADWPAMRKKYAEFLPHLATRNDLNRLIQWMCSELAVGHHNVGGGDFLHDSDSVSGGLLGADYEVVDGRYRFRKVYGGLNWNPTLRAPLSEPGVDVAAGEYLLAVEGEELRAPENLYSRFENTAGKIVEITVGPNADGTDSRTVEVVPVAREVALRNRDWVEGNIAKVTAATDGRVAYVHVPDTAGMGHLYFKRYFYPQADREAIIVDERYNSGGLYADYVIDLLRRPYVAHWAMRYGADLETPQGAIHGPKVMLIDENAGSGGDLLPWMFRKFELGTLVGRPTWGGLVGMLGFPPLMDGGSVTAPNLGIWTEDGFVVENVGVPPDVEVEMWPADVIAGRDPQLEKAIEIALEELERNPPPKHERPPFPVRVRK